MPAPQWEVFVTCSGLGPGRSHILPLIWGLYHAQRTSTVRASRICPLLEDFLLHSGLQPQEPQELLLVERLCHVQQTLTMNGLRNCPSLEDLVLHSKLWPLGPQETVRVWTFQTHFRPEDLELLAQSLISCLAIVRVQKKNQSGHRQNFGPKTSDLGCIQFLCRTSPC